MESTGILKNWMSYIKDEVRLVDVVLPGAHNAGSYGMNFTACCQDHDMYTQAQYGCRYFCIRINTLSNGEIVLTHGPTKGESFEKGIEKLAKAVDELDGEFFLIDVREYYPQVLLGKHLTFSADAKKVDAILEKHLHCSEYALHGFDHISDMTMGDIRRTGKKFVLINYRGEYKYSDGHDLIFPWKKHVYGGFLRKYIRDSVKLFDEFHTNGFYWFQIQRTPTIGAVMGLVNPRLLEKQLAKKLDKQMDSIENNPEYLRQANILGGDFMTWNDKKCKRIIKMNLKKNNIIEAKSAEFEEKLK